VKTILILLLACLAGFAVRAQTFPDLNPATNNAAQDQMLRNALRARAAGQTNPPPMTPVVPVATPPRVNPAAAPAFPVLPGTPLPSPAAPPQVQPAVPTIPAPAVPGGQLAPPASDPASVALPQADQIIGAGEIDFRNTSLDQVLDFYALLVNRTILHAVLPPTQITLKSQTDLTKREAVQAFESILAMNGLTLINVGDKFVKAVPTQLAGATGAPFSHLDENQLPDTDQYTTRIVNLKYLKASDVLSALQPFAGIANSVQPIGDTSMLIIRDYAINVKRMLEVIRQLDVIVPLEWDSKVIPIKYALADDIASALSTLGGGGGASIGNGARPGGGGSTPLGGGGLGGGLGGVGSPLGGGINPGGVNTGGLNGGLNRGGLGGTAGAGRSSLTDRINQVARAAGGSGDINILGKTKIIADRRTNSLLVFAGKQDMEMIEKIVSQLDIVLAQVLIEAIIMEVSLDTSHSVGVSYLQKNASTPGNYFNGIGAVNNGTFLSPGSFVASGTNGQPNVPSGLSYLASFGGDFDATITAIANDSHINVLSRPRIQTSHGVPATLQVGQQVPIVSGTYFGGINGQASSQYNEQFVGISLQVTPLINPDGLVVMDINQNVQQLGPNYTIDGNPVPSTTQRSAQATVSVRDHDTIILGGMIQTTKNVSNAGVPLLKDIPGLGYLFRSSSSDNQRTELIILIRPTVLPTPEAAAKVASHERDRLPGIKAAEAEENRDAKLRMQQGSKIQVPKDGE
jgi:general secretion pathway protein D